MSRRARTPRWRRFGARIALVAVTVGALLGAGLQPAVAADGAAGASRSIVAPAVADSLAADVVKTANLAAFRPGNIMSDAVFFNKYSMTEAQIQAFLNAKVRTCQSGYTCLKSYRDTSRTMPADPMCSAYAGNASEPASRIIYKVARACGINPQVLLVTLQKEQSLVTSTAPSASRYRAAMGQGCPDTAACDTAYYGFFNQVYGAAHQFKRYANPPGTSQYFTWYAPGKTWNVLYHPNRACGTSAVYIENQATANLYYYTPYRPNSAALNAGYGLGDSCSSYGNRNFYNYFTDWFGSTQISTVSSVDSARHVLTLDAAGTVRAFPLTGSGSWKPAVILAEGWSGVAEVISIGDLDGDGHRDAIGVGSDGATWFYGGDGGIAYKARVALGVDWSASVLRAAAGDFDSDGLPDAFTTDPSGNLLLWRGTETGSFGPPKVIGTGWQGMNLLVGGGDFSGDGRVDLIARTKEGLLKLFRGNGGGGWASSTVIGNGWQALTAIVNPGDFNGDRVPDLLARDSTGAMRLYAGTGGGYVRSAGTVGTGWAGFTSIVGPGPAAGAVRVLQPGAGDIDDDGRRDVLATNPQGALLLYRGSGTGGWLGTTTVDAAAGSAGRVIPLGDFTGDGLEDIATIGTDGVFSLRKGNGTGGFAAGVTIGSGWQGMNLVFGGIDFDGDHKRDVMARDADGYLRLYRGDGAGGWAESSRTVGSGWGGFSTVFAVGDFTGDRNPDIIARLGGSLVLYPTNGVGGWLSSRVIGTGWAGFTAVFSPGNFDGAGGPDVIARAADGRLYLYRGSGKGTWAGSAAIGSGWNSFTWLG